MKCIYCNIRGIGNLETQLHLIQMIEAHKPDFLFLAEPMVTYATVPIWLWNRIHFYKYAVNNRQNNIPNIWCLWNTQLDPTILFTSEQCIVFSYVT